MKTQTTGLFLAILLFSMVYSSPSKGQTPQKRYGEVLNLWGNKDNDEEVMALLNETIEADSTFSAAYLSRGGIKHRLGDLKGSEADYTKAIQFNPQVAIYYHARGSLRIDIGNMEGSLIDLDKSIELDSSFASGYYARSMAREITENWQGVIEDCTKLIEMFPPDKFPNYEGKDHYRRGNARFKLDDIKGACDDWRVVVGIANKSCECREDALEKLKRYCQ